MTDNDEPREEPVVRDRRRIDPVTGQLREPRVTAAPAAPGAGDAAPAPDEVEDEVARAQAEATELLGDLQRLQAEYRNYRRRVERDRELVREQAVSAALGELLPVLDDIGRARDHGDLTGGFKVVGEALESTLGRLGLVRFGAVGDAFDPKIHEALAHSYSDEVDAPTCVEVLMVGYRMGERVLRPAMVAVAEPTVGLPQPADDAGESADDAGEPADEQG